MCGLVGVAGKLEFADERLIKQLLVDDYWRGPDSTGLASVRTNNDVHIAKIASHPIDLFDMKHFEKALSGWQSKAFIGHNRSATRGKVSAVNAHPFQFDNIVGAHNGTLSTKSHKDLEAAAGQEFNVDSMAIFAAIAKVGIDETVKLLQGAWALTWFDLEVNKLFLLRNDQRPLWYSVSEDFKKVIWASEYEFIAHSVQHEKQPQPLYKDPNKGYRFWETEIDALYEFDIAKMREATALVKPKIRTLKGKEPPKVVKTTANDDDPFGRESIMSTMGLPPGPHTSTTNSTTTTSPSNNHIIKKEVRPDSRVCNLLGHADDPFAGLLSREKFEGLAAHGCSYCSADIQWGDKGISVYERQDAILCHKCSRGDEKANRVYIPNIDVMK